MSSLCKFALTLGLSIGGISVAEAQTCPSLTTFTNGTSADASQVNNNFSTLEGCINNGIVGVTAVAGGNVGIGTTTPSSPLTVNGVIQSTSGGVKFPDGTIQNSAASGLNLITGNLPSAISGTSTTAQVTISSGGATDSTGSSIIKGAGYSWAVSNGMAINGYQGGTTLPNSSTIHFFLCTGGTGTGSLASTSLTPACPSGYNTYYRRIFSLNTTASGALIPGTAVETFGGAIAFYLSTQTLDYSSTIGAASRTLATLNVPTGMKLQWLGRLNTFSTSSYCIVTSPDETDVAPVTSAIFNAAPGNDIFNNGTAAGSPYTTSFVTVNTNGQIGIRCNVSDTGYVVTRGWIDFRRS